MSFKIIIEREKNSPIYRQIIERIISGVENGILKGGNKLPAERELANQLNTSRGTITKAYQELENLEIIEVIQGRGSFISKERVVRDESRKEKAIKIINETIDDLENLNFSSQEIKIFIDILMMEREKKSERMSMATVDCNPEALDIFKKQLGYIKNISITRFLLKDLKNTYEASNLLKEYDLVITTSTHYNHLSTLIPNLKERIIKAAVSPSQQTIINFAKIPEDSQIGILCYSERFLNIIKNTLKYLQVDGENIAYIYDTIEQKQNIQNFIKSKDVIIIPSDSNIKYLYFNEIDKFKKKGGEVIKFEYQIERGTLIYIEERIAKTLSEKNKKY